jgi:hypothetical protein
VILQHHYLVPVRSNHELRAADQGRITIGDSLSLHLANFAEGTTTNSPAGRPSGNSSATSGLSRKEIKPG